MHIATPSKLKRSYPLSAEQSRFVAETRNAVRAIVSGKDLRLAIVAGPCSIHDLASAIEYGKRLKELSKEVQRSCLLVMRVYVEKPRTITGWKGLLYDPLLDGSNDVATGLAWTRELLRELASLEIPTATEFLDPLAAVYIDDLVTWGFIGARTSASQTHRQLASWLPMPVGFKNSVDGNIDLAIHGVIAARSPHTFLHIGPSGRVGAFHSEGNPYTHIVLRGSLDGANYDGASVQQAALKMQAAGVKGRLLIDCAHGNSQKSYEKQKEAFISILDQIEEGHVMGMMMESHLSAGSQFLSESPSSLKYGVSITDPCIDWSSTEQLVLSAAATFSNGKFRHFHRTI